MEIDSKSNEIIKLKQIKKMINDYYYPITREHPYLFNRLVVQNPTKYDDSYKTNSNECLVDTNFILLKILESQKNDNTTEMKITNELLERIIIETNVTQRLITELSLSKITTNRLLEDISQGLSKRNFRLFFVMFMMFMMSGTFILLILSY
jgi:uncharacterized membrane protein YjjP (DUF1212 family)